MADYLPEEILIRILARLPVKSLIKFRCVSKSWYSLISSHDFMNTHLNLNKNNNFSLFECTYPVFRRFLEDTVDEYAFRFRIDDVAFIIDGVCNGLLCLSDLDKISTVLWNPSINKYVTLPTPNFTSLSTSVIGFGFDSRANEYKVVRVQYLSKNYPPQVLLCELSKGTWRQIPCTVPANVFCCFWYKSQACVNCVVHWIALDSCCVNGPRNSIVAFDMVDEVFHEMALPDKVADNGFVKHLSIGIFEESLMVVVYDHPRPLNKCSVWVMKEYGVAKSWVNQFDLNLGAGLCIVQSYVKNGELSLETTSKQLIQPVKVVEFHSPHSCSLYVGTYIESLVLLNGRQTYSCDAVTSERKEDENGKQQCPIMLEEAKTTKKTRFEIGHWSGIKYEPVGKKG